MLRSFYFKLVAIFTAIVLLVGILIAFTSIRASSMIVKESVQKTNRLLAAQFVSEFEPLLENERVVEEIEKKLLELSGSNPQFDFYLLGPDGRVKNYLHGNQKGLEPKIDFIDTEPLEQFISGEPLPILAPDPLNPDRMIPFSTAHIDITGSTNCYIYIVLEGHQFSQTASMIAESYILRGSLWIIGLILLISLLVGILVFGMLTGRLKTIKKTMHAFERGQLQRRIPVKSQDEIADISRCFNKMADTVVESMNEIKKTDKLRRELVANVSHDLRSPLASIQGYLETIDMKKENLPPEELNSYIETALKNTRMLNKMINNLFDLSKLDAKNVIPNLEYVCFAELVQDLVQVFEPIASQKNVTLKAELPENPQVRIHADVSLMERALSNLIENAIEHTPEGGSVTLQTVQEGEDIELKINDTGDGIDQKDLPFVFDRFYQVDKSRSNSKGAGLGLSIAKKILDLHGAKISIDSLLNHGTTFIIRMPSLN